MAESLGAQTVILHGTSEAKTVAGYARLRKTSKILVSSPARVSWYALRHVARIAILKRHAAGVEIIAIVTGARSDRPSDNVRPTHLHGERSRPLRWPLYAWGLGTTAVCTAVAFPIFPYVDAINIAMVYVLGAAAAGLWLGRGPSALVSVANIAAFDYFYVPPRFSLLVSDSSYLVTFAVMLLVALVISNLMIAVRKQTEAAAAREHHTAVLYAITHELAATRDAQSMAEIAVRRIGEELQSSALILFCNDRGEVARPPAAATGASGPLLDIVAAQWVATTGRPAGMRTRHFMNSPAMYLPLADEHTTLGVLVVEPADLARSLESQELLDAFVGQFVAALQRVRLTEAAHAAHVAAQRAAMRNTLLASISHDLRTPLAAIAGAGSIVAQSDFVLDIFRRVTLGHLIEEKARDMSELLSNVLELVRLESGADVLNRDWHSIADLVGLAIQRHEARLTGWRVIIDLPEDLPMLSVDATLFVQLLGNLLENAVKYTPRETRIAVSATVRHSTLQLAVEDNGPGWATDAPEQMFEKFSRAHAESAASGVGLGLAICKAIVRLHHGEIRATAGRHRGARVEIDLPLPAEHAQLAVPVSET